MASPRTSTGNLTGSARVLNDMVVTFHNTVQNWKSCFVDGIKIIQNIQESRENEDVVERNCERMGKLVETMQDHITSLKECSRKIYNLYLLNKSSSSPCYTWSYEKLAQAVQFITNAYAEDTVFKEKITQSLQKRSLQQIDIIAVFWVHSGHINSRIDASLEAVLKECMLK
ncbi:unnamed protein product [Allacma fusca]|uniref:Uncharacterized protein n=1 Tax=Allacma fusca TaxID=39272 RepID=A0A8J2K616_9HEXA|nr:unnamed protein product [Allacma fusca]